MMTQTLNTILIYIIGPIRRRVLPFVVGAVEKRTPDSLNCFRSCGLCVRAVPCGA
ncbi:hypothetical protein BJY59DRAFT_686051 [Rhodotorula toruloides]